MIYAAEDIKKNWKKTGSIKMRNGSYSTWEKDDLIAGIHEEDDEVVIVINSKTGRTIQEDVRSAMRLNKTFSGTVGVGVISVRQVSKEDYERKLVDSLPIVQTIVKEIEPQMPSNWELHYVKQCDECDQKPCITIVYVRRDIDVKVCPHAPMVSFCCPVNKPVFEVLYGFADEASPLGRRTIVSSEPSGLEEALRFMEKNNG